MTTAGKIGAEVVRELAAAASTWTGFSPDAIHESSIESRVCAWLSAGGDLDVLRRRARDGEPSAVQLLAEAVSVGETYFFRQIDHFDWLARNFRLHERLEARGVVHAWSAGCATGEEAWSLASFLRAHAPPGAALQVVGTDLVARNVATAREGTYRRWSARSDPKYPVVHEVSAGQLVVMKHLRPLVTFATHNLLEPLAESFGRFDLVLCRNVLVYLDPDAARRVCEHLARALAPDGLVVFAPADLRASPSGLSPVGPVELRMFGPRRPDDTRPNPSRALRSRPPTAPRHEPPARRSAQADAAARTGATVTPQRDATRTGATLTARRDVTRTSGTVMPTEPPSATAPHESPAVTLHLTALAFLDRGDRSSAGRLLAELEATAPGYLPGLLECALFHQQAGHRRKAERLMRALLQRVSQLPPEMSVPGPREMPVAFYATSARAFFEGRKLTHVG